MISNGVHILCIISFLSVTEGRLRSYEDLLPQCLQKSTKIFSSNNFRKAQEEIEVINKPRQEHSERVPWAGTFYNTDWGANLYNISGMPIAYAVVFKVNSENIHNSLSAHDYQHQIQPIDLRTDWKEHVKRYRSTSLHDLKGKQTTAHGHQSVLQMFTFVRDPLEHFISGLVESHFRGMGFGAHPQLKGKAVMDKFMDVVAKNQVDMNFTKTILDSFIFGHNSKQLKEKIKQWKHFYPQFFAIRKWQPKFVGYLDNFEEDWTRMQSKLNVDIKYTSDMSHVTQGDVFGFKKLLQQLFRDDPRYLRALCHLLIRDYICLGFELPVPCADMYDTYEVDFAALLVSNSYAAE